MTILNTHIHEQVAAAHRRDLLEAADRARLAAQARPRLNARRPFRWRVPRRQPALEPCRSAPSPISANR
jgi:hypothetical protein